MAPPAARLRRAVAPPRATPPASRCRDRRSIGDWWGMSLTFVRGAAQAAHLTKRVAAPITCAETRALDGLKLCSQASGRRAGVADPLDCAKREEHLPLGLGHTGQAGDVHAL